ncbi:MAG TPA: class I SAM-dependent methyltransferase [Mycobacterium sp.]|nr:class I SAM-dependent methyltransferase [Mycobacterium sp.]HQC77761.1 class I SAM-dependent methyltransferase [Mycobacterium sp.]
MDNERIKYTVCPLCQSPNIREFGRADWSGDARWREPLDPIMVWMECGECIHSFTDGYFTDETLGVLFASTIDAQIVGLDIEDQRIFSAKMVQRVADLIGMPDGRLWLDVGFGSGSLLMTAKEFGFDVFGVDLRKKNVDDIQLFEIPAYYGTMESARRNVAFATRPTVISMADVVEHEPFPADSLRSARALIQDSGLLLISMPNASAALWRYWNSLNVNPYWAEIEHYHNFTRESLYRLLETTGFKPIHYAISERYRCCMEILAKAV